MTLSYLKDQVDVLPGQDVELHPGDPFAEGPLLEGVLAGQDDVVQGDLRLVLEAIAQDGDDSKAKLLLREIREHDSPGAHVEGFLLSDGDALAGELVPVGQVNLVEGEQRVGLGGHVGSFGFSASSAIFRTRVNVCAGVSSIGSTAAMSARARSQGRSAFHLE